MANNVDFWRVCKERDEWRERAEELMDTVGMPYPLDADGEPIHVGDVMEIKFDVGRKPFTVSFIGERAVAFWVEGQPDLKSFNLDTVLLVHHHEPDVEDVLREMLDEHRRWFDGEGERTVGEMVADYASRLQLKED